LISGGSDDLLGLNVVNLVDVFTGSVWLTADSMGTPREFHTATPIGSDKVLLAGGFNFAGAGNAFLVLGDSVEYDASALAAVCLQCFPFACTKNTNKFGVCPNSCSADGDCIPGFYCATNGQCLRRGDLGFNCSTDNGCLSGFCADGVCCNRRCDATCEACNRNTPGTCSTVFGTPAAGHNCPISPGCAKQYCDGSSPKSSACTCTLANGQACAIGDQCTAGHCVQNVCCDGACGPCGDCLQPQAGHCTILNGNLVQPCGLNKCDGIHATCNPSCTLDGDCVEGSRCSSGLCVPICIGGVCTCSAGLTWCAARNACIDPTFQCCSDTDCTSPPDCHQGGTCNGGRCLYAPLNCDAAPGCAPGVCSCVVPSTCSPASVRFEIQATSPSYSFAAISATPTALTVSGRLTVLGAGPVIVSRYDIGTIEPVLFTESVTGAPVPSSFRSVSFYVPVEDAQASFATPLDSLNPTAAFDINGVFSYDRSSRSARMFRVPGPGTYLLPLAYRYQQTGWIMSNTVTINVGP